MDMDILSNCQQLFNLQTRTLEYIITQGSALCIYRRKNMVVAQNQKPDSFQLGLVEFNKGNYPAAVVHFLTAVDKNPKKYLAWDFLSKAYIQQGLYEEAKKPTEKALKIARQIAAHAAQQEDMNTQIVDMLQRRSAVIKQNLRKK